MKKFFFSLFILLIILAGGAAIWWNTNMAPADANDKSQKIFVVQQGESIRTIGEDLEQAGFIKNALAFSIWVKLQKLDNKIQSGDFRLSPSQSLAVIAQNLTHSSLDYWLRIPEGERADQIAERIQAVSPKYNASWKNQLEENEGYLFPDSYLIPTGADITDIIAIMRKNFDAKYATLGTIPEAKQHDIVTMASIIQREAKYEDEQRTVASVLYNRLDIGMALQVDASVQYALGYYVPKHTWWKPGLSLDDLKFDSPYNTYQNTGLPPGPISNPGLPALQAAAHPDTSDYMYYVSDQTGHIHFAETFKQHNALIEKYNVQ